MGKRAPILLPRGINQSFQDKDFTEKKHHYLRENILTQTLHENCYENNPRFLRFKNENNLNFKLYISFTKESVMERQLLYEKLVKDIWNNSNN